MKKNSRLPSPPNGGEFLRHPGAVRRHPSGQRGTVGRAGARAALRITALRVSNTDIPKQARTQRDRRSGARRTVRSAIRRAVAAAVAAAAVHPGRFNGAKHLAITIGSTSVWGYVGLVTCNPALGRTNIVVTPADTTYYTITEFCGPCLARVVIRQRRATNLWVQDDHHRVIFYTHICRMRYAWQKNHCK